MLELTDGDEDDQHNRFAYGGYRSLVQFLGRIANRERLGDAEIAVVNRTN